jgi:putative transposase
MERKEPFVEDEIYHLYTRGVEKRDVFLSDRDRDRFVLLLHASNRKLPVRMDNLLRREQGEPLLRVPEGEALVDISAYALMPNHIHLLIRERQKGNVSKFMLKLMTGYSMYFNTRYERSGPLFTRPFRSRHIDSDDYLRWAFAYITLNPLDLLQHDWKTCGIENARAAAFLRNYKYSSFPDYFSSSRTESRILTPLQSIDLGNFDTLLATLSDMPEFENKDAMYRSTLV